MTQIKPITIKTILILISLLVKILLFELMLQLVFSMHVEFITIIEFKPIIAPRVSTQPIICMFSIIKINTRFWYLTLKKDKK